MDQKKQSSKLQFTLNPDTTPVLYTDNIFMNANTDGVTLNVGQKIINTTQVKIVTRIGMSRTHAKKFVAEMSKLLAMTEGHLQSGDKN